MNMNTKNTSEKYVCIFTNIINKIESEAEKFENLEFNRQTSLLDELLLAINFGFSEHKDPLFKLAIRRLDKILDVYSLDSEQYTVLKKTILKVLATDGCEEFKAFLNCYKVKGLKNISERIIISDLEIITCLLIKHGLEKDALLASKILIEYAINFIEITPHKRDETVKHFFNVASFILSMTARGNNKIVFCKTLENIITLLNLKKIINVETKNSFQNFIINALLFTADKNWLGVFKIIEFIVLKISWRDDLFTEISHKIIYEWVQIISMLIVRKWNKIQQEFLLGLIKFSTRCNKENNMFSNLMISKILILQISKDGIEKTLTCFKTWFVFISLKMDLIAKKQIKNGKKEIICSSNKYVELLYNFFVFTEKLYIKCGETYILKLWYEFWSDKKNKKAVYYRIDALTKVVLNYWLILHDDLVEANIKKKIYLNDVLNPTVYEKKYQYLIYDRSNIKL